MTPLFRYERRDHECRERPRFVSPMLSDFMAKNPFLEGRATEKVSLHVASMEAGRTLPGPPPASRCSNNPAALPFSPKRRNGWCGQRLGLRPQ